MTPDLGDDPNPQVVSGRGRVTSERLPRPRNPKNRRRSTTATRKASRTPDPGRSPPKSIMTMTVAAIQAPSLAKSPQRNTTKRKAVIPRSGGARNIRRSGMKRRMRALAALRAGPTDGHATSHPNRSMSPLRLGVDMSHLRINIRKLLREEGITMSLRKSDMIASAEMVGMLAIQRRIGMSIRDRQNILGI